jgi:hypothetical protein
MLVDVEGKKEKGLRESEWCQVGWREQKSNEGLSASILRSHSVYVPASFSLLEVKRLSSKSFQFLMSSVLFSDSDA